MANLYESAQENLARTYIADNIRLEKELAEAKARLQAAEAAIDKLKNLLVYYQDGETKGDNMGRYVYGIKHQAFRPAYKEHITVEAIVKIMHEDKTTDLNYVAQKLGTSYTTVYRRLKDPQLHPINKKEIAEYYQLFCSD